jgi:hypothetical protein
MGDKFVTAERADREGETTAISGLRVGLEKTRGESYHHRTKSIDILSSPVAAIALGNDEGPRTGDFIDTADEEGAEFVAIVVCTTGGSKGSPIAAASNSLNPGSSTFSFCMTPDSSASIAIDRSPASLPSGVCSRDGVVPARLFKGGK